MHYHVFLSYNSHDQSEASLIFQYLKDSNYKTFFEKDALKPGDIWQKKIEDALLSSDVIIILLGSQGVGRWQEIESRIYQIISTQCIEEKKPIIPVYLPRVNEASDREKFPIFLKQFHEFRFKESIDNEIINLLTHLTCDTSSLNNYERPILSYQQDILLKNTTRCYNKNAEKYFETWKDIISPSLYAFADEVNKIKKTARILDVGCGPGHHSKFLAKRGHEVIGVDISESFISIANKNMKEGARFINLDMRSLFDHFDRKRNIFDTIWACASCFHLTKEFVGWQLDQFNALLKPQGLLGISFQVDMPSAIQEDGRFFERYLEGEIETTITRHGFDIFKTIKEETNKNTFNKKQMKKWCNYFALAPERKIEVTIPNNDGLN